METVRLSDAVEYAASIAGEVRQLDRVLAGEEDAATAEAVAGWQPDGDYGDPFAFYLAHVLDVAVRVDVRGIEYGHTVEILRTFGGPGCWIVRNHDDGEQVEVRACWGGETASVYVWAPALAESLDQYAEEVAA